MKKTQTKNSNFLAIAAIILASGATAPAFAGEIKTKEPSASTVAVKYLGSVNEHPVIEVGFNNTGGEAVVVTLKDANGTILYSEHFSGNVFQKKFRFDKVNLSEEDMNLKLEISSKSTKEVQAFTISNTTYTVNNVVISNAK